jgi:hypothetical protein
MTEFTKQQILVATRKLREENAGIRPKKAEVMQYLTEKYYKKPEKKSVSSSISSLSSLSSSSSSTSSSSSSSSSSDPEDWDDDKWGIKWPAPKLQKEDVGPGGAEVARRLDEFENTRSQVIAEKGSGLRDFSQTPPQPEGRKRWLTEADLEPAVTPPASPRKEEASIGYSQENNLFRRGTPSDGRAYAALKKVEEEQKKKEAEKAAKRKVQRERDEAGRKGEGYAYPGRPYVRSKELTKARVLLEARAAERVRLEAEAEAERVRKEAEKVVRQGEKVKKGLETAERWEAARRKKTERDHRLRGI